jgi:arylsulfatase A-like enzyme
MYERRVRPGNTIPFILFFLTAISCSGSGDKPDKGASQTVKPPTTTEPAAPPAAKKAADTPLAAPRSYFGEPPLPRRSLSPLFRQGKKQESVILLVIDAQNAKHLGIYGNPRPTSPHIDGLARGGLLLTNYVSNSSWTRPSFATIVTGLPKSVHGVEMKNNNIDMDITTLAERFRLAGYKTAGFVGNPLVREVWGFGQGFQIYEDTASLKDIFPPDRVLADKALEWLERAGDDPYFLMIFFTAPHAPYRSPKHKFISTVPDGPVLRNPLREYPKPLDKGTHARIVAAYDDEVLYVDEQVGRILTYVNSDAMQRKPTVVVTADHGEAFGKHNCYTHTYHMWESTLRVPFILSSPALRETGVYDDRPFTHLDIAPTLLDLAGIEHPPEKYPGISMVKAMEKASKGRERILFSQYNAHGVQREAIREGRWKLIHHHKVENRAAHQLNRLEPGIPHRHPRDLPSLAWDKERYELYDLAADPGEKTDLFPKMARSEDALFLVHALQPLIGESENPAELTEEMREALENAGYIQSSPKEKDAKNDQGEVR